MQQNISPLPWSIEEWRGSTFIVTSDPDSDAVARVFGCHKGSEQQKADAAFIVKACNTHDQLKDALQEAKALLEFNGINIDDDADYGNGVAGDIMARIAVALAAAGAE